MQKGRSSDSHITCWVFSQIFFPCRSFLAGTRAGGRPCVQRWGWTRINVPPKTPRSLDFPSSALRLIQLQEPRLCNWDGSSLYPGNWLTDHSPGNLHLSGMTYTTHYKLSLLQTISVLLKALIK